MKYLMRGVLYFWVFAPFGFSIGRKMGVWKTDYDWCWFLGLAFFATIVVLVSWAWNFEGDER